RIAKLRYAFITRVLGAREEVLLTCPGVETPGERLPGHASFCFPAISAVTVLLDLEQSKVVPSSSSAGSAGSDEPSHVLTALGIPAEVAQTAVRFTLGPGVTAEQMDTAAHAVEQVLAGR